MQIIRRYYKPVYKRELLSHGHKGNGVTINSAQEPSLARLILKDSYDRALALYNATKCRRDLKRAIEARERLMGLSA